MATPNIQWPMPSGPSSMSIKINDNDHAPASILDDSQDILVDVDWNVPASFQALMPGGDFRIRLYAESLGNGQEKQIGVTEIVSATNAAKYSSTIKIGAGSLKGEGAMDSAGNPVAGVYKLVAVLQHRNGFGTATAISGFAESGLIQIRTP